VFLKREEEEKKMKRLRQTKKREARVAKSAVVCGCVCGGDRESVPR